MAGCAAFLPLLRLPCGETPARPVRRACVHEHIRDASLCDFHLGVTDMGRCRACFDIDGHECPISVMLLDETAGRPS